MQDHSNNAAGIDIETQGKIIINIIFFSYTFFGGITDLLVLFSGRSISSSYVAADH